MAERSRAIQGLIVFSAVFGVLFLWEVYPLLPPSGFDFVAIGWVLFVFDAALTFFRPRVSYYLGFILALAALLASVGEPQHYSILQSGDILHVLTILIGDVAEVLIIILVPYHFLRGRGRAEERPGAKSQV